MSATEDVPIRIEAPLPLGVAGTLMQLIGAAWPEAVIETNGNHYALNMRIPKAAAKTVDQEFIDELVRHEEESATDGATFLGFRDGWMAFAPPEELCLELGQIAHAIFMSHQDAVNHVEWTVRVGQEPGDPSYVLSVSRSQEQTPLAMRKKAEAEVERLTSLLRKHGIDPEGAS